MTHTSVYSDSRSEVKGNCEWVGQCFFCVFYLDVFMTYALCTVKVRAHGYVVRHLQENYLLLMTRCRLWRILSTNSKSSVRVAEQLAVRQLESLD